MAFDANIRRAWAFLRIFDKPGGQRRTRGRPSDNEKELLRATVVFALAALDAYLHDLVIERVVAGAGDSTAMHDALRNIAKEDPALSLRIALAGSEAERRDEFAAALDTWLSSKSFQGPEAVVRALGYIGLGTAQPQIERDVDPDWARQLRKWTEMRHGLVHRAEKPLVNRAMAAESVQLVENLVRTIDTMVFASR